MDKQYYRDLKNSNERLLEKEIAEKKTILSAFPTEAAVYFTKQCNLFCIKCFRRYPVIMESQDEMDQALFESIAHQIFPTLIRAETTLSGEPLMCPYWDRVVELFRHYGTMMNITTNGTLLTEQVIESLNGVTDWLKVSFDSCVKETYESIHVGATFEDTVRNLRNFGRMKKKMSPEPWFRLGIVLMKRNIEQLPRYIEFAKEIGADQVETLGWVSYHPDFRDEELFDIRDQANAALDAAIEKASELGMDLELGFRRVPRLKEDGTAIQEEECALLEDDHLYWKGSLDDYKQWRGKYRFRTTRDICEFFFHRPYIHGNGRVESCGNNETRAMGNLREQTFKEIWNNELYQDIRRRFYAGPEEWLDMCHRCICINPTYDAATYRKNHGVEPEKELEGVWAALNRRIPLSIRKRISPELKRFIKRYLV